MSHDDSNHQVGPGIDGTHRQSWSRLSWDGHDDHDEYLEGYGHNLHQEAFGLAAEYTADKRTHNDKAWMRQQRQAAGPGEEKQLRLWWWWEIGSVLVAIICAAVQVGVLIAADGTILAAWPFFLGPNTVARRGWWWRWRRREVGAGWPLYGRGEMCARDMRCFRTSLA